MPESQCCGRLPRSYGVTVLLLGCLLGQLCNGAPAGAAILDPDFWATNGVVRAMALANGRLYIGGEFGYVGPNTGGGVRLDATTGASLPAVSRVKGRVLAATADGHGGWYIGGLFTAIGDSPRANLAHIRADGSLDPWNPGTDAAVLAIGVDVDGFSRGKVYVGGRFYYVNGVLHPTLARLDGTTGTLDTEWAPNVNGTYNDFPVVYAMVVTCCGLYIGGSFGSVNGAPTNNLASLTTDSPTLVFSYGGGTDLPVKALALVGQTLYLGGDFTGFPNYPGPTPQLRSHIAAFDGFGQLTGWNPGANGIVTGLAANATTVYAGGSFTSVGGRVRSGLAAIDASTGLATNWSPTTAGSVAAIAEYGSSILAAGGLTSIAGVTTSGIAAVDKVTGATTVFARSSGGVTVSTLAISGSEIYAGGFFTSMGGQPRTNLAALDITTGRLTDWSPLTGTYNGIGVLALAVQGSLVYAGGNFLLAGGQPRNYLAAIDAVTGLATGWNPGANAAVNAILVRGSTVYVGGQFSTLGGMPRSRLGAVSTVSGLTTAWNPSPNSSVAALATDGRVVYAGGTFSMVGGQSRYAVAALDTITGTPTPWSVGVARASLGTGDVEAIAIDGNTVYLGGLFAWVGTNARTNLAAVDATTGIATSWNPGTGGGDIVLSLAVANGTVYVGGNLVGVGGLTRNGIAAVDEASGNVLGWAPEAWGSVNEIVVQGASVFVGGAFFSVDGIDCQGLARLVRVDVLAVPPLPVGHPDYLVIDAIAPNPARGQVRVEFTSPRATIVRIGVIDVTGREVAVLADGPYRSGRNAIEWSGRAGDRELSAGIYFMRITVDGRTASKRWAVIH